MTILVGMMCTDGIVLGADSSSTFSAGNTPTIEQPTRKLHVVGNSVLLAGTGSVGLNQRFHAIVQDHYDRKVFAQKEPMECAKSLCAAAISDFGSTSATRGTYGALVAFCHGNKPYLVEFGVTDFQPEFKDENIWYVSMGSGQVIADPFLGLMRSAFYPAGPPTLSMGVFVAAWALAHTIEVNPGGIKEPLRLAVIRKTDGHMKACELTGDELIEHNASIEAAKQYLSAYADRFDTPDAPEVPEPPALPAK